jgi:murein DD-endopeptidase MepM/ murein hydrolase activator NlpD
MVLIRWSRAVVRAVIFLTVLLGAVAPASAASDPKFQSLFNSWAGAGPVVEPRLAISIPSQKPIEAVTYSSHFGVRADPFRGTAAMHAGVDLPGPIGTPIYATADGIVARSEWASGYGNLVEIDHGHGIATRYGHMSQLLVPAGRPVKRGDLIGLMGSTGRSTGSHLHYEVRLDGRAVDPVPFLEGDNYVTALNTIAAAPVQVAAVLPELAAQDSAGDQ